MHWFGPVEFAPVCQTNPRAEIPIGDKCDHCAEPFVEEDFGFVLVGWEDDLYYHRECFLSMLGISPR